jgi:hypothetical protein
MDHEIPRGALFDARSPEVRIAQARSVLPVSRLEQFQTPAHRSVCAHEFIELQNHGSTRWPSRFIAFVGGWAEIVPRMLTPPDATRLP